MFKKIMALILALSLCLLVVGCGDKENVESKDEITSSTESKVEVEEGPKTFVNPLTGEATVSEAQSKKRPVAIMVNNVNIAQPVQTGVNKADIVYETEVEGGVTRLLAVYNDVSGVEKIGSVRSARYDYIDLALGHNAIFFHCGCDPDHAKPHLDDVDNIEFNSNNEGGARIKNGLASEHTFYAYGSGMVSRIEKAGFASTVSEVKNWQNFAKEGEEVTLGNTANSVKVSFSYPTTFKYDAELGKYVRYCKDNKRVDYFTKDDTQLENVFILVTNIGNFNCKGEKYQHKKIDLSSGEGYYCVNGTYTKIKWSKGDSKNGFTFTNEDGSPLTVNAGNSWVCIVDDGTKLSLE